MTRNGLIAVIVAFVAVIAVITVVAVVNDNNSSDEYTVTYDYNYTEGKGPSETETVRYKADTSIDERLVTREYYSFVGWYKDSTCTVPVSFPYKVTKDVTFYAKWDYSAIAKYFNTKYLTDTAEGRAFAQSFKETTGATELSPTFSGTASAIIACGNDYAVFKVTKGNLSTYTVLDLIDMEVSFQFPTDNVIDVVVCTNTTLKYEYIEVSATDGYYVYGSKGGFVGPNPVAAVPVLDSMLLIDDVFYKFDENGRITYSFDYSAKKGIPQGGNDGSYYELTYMTNSLGKFPFEVNILDEEFNVKNTFSFPAGSEFCKCASLYNGKFLLQYATVVSDNEDDYSFISEGKKYKLESWILDEDRKNNTRADIDQPIASGMDRYASGFIDWNTIAKDIKDLILFYNVSITKHLTNDTVLKSLNDDGSEYKVMLTTLKYDQTSVVPVNGYIIGFRSSIHTDYIHFDIIDGNAHTFKITLENIANINSGKYFVTKAADESLRTDFVIYDINGKAVGDFTDMTYLGSSHNALFFKNGDDVEVFSDGKFTTYLDSDVTIQDSFYIVKSAEPGSEYIYYTENGNEICRCDTLSYKVMKTSEGNYIIEAYVATNSTKIFKLTTL